MSWQWVFSFRTYSDNFLASICGQLFRTTRVALPLVACMRIDWRYSHNSNEIDIQMSLLDSFVFLKMNEKRLRKENLCSAFLPGKNTMHNLQRSLSYQRLRG